MFYQHLNSSKSEFHYIGEVGSTNCSAESLHNIQLYIQLKEVMDRRGNELR